jgi:hypothetical protein
VKVTLVPFNQSRRLSHTRSPAELAREEQAFYEEYAEPWKLALGGWVPVSLVLILFGALVEISYAFH